MVRVFADAAGSGVTRLERFWNAAVAITGNQPQFQPVIKATGFTRENVFRLINPAILEQAERNDAAHLLSSGPIEPTMRAGNDDEPGKEDRG